LAVLAPPSFPAVSSTTTVCPAAPSRSVWVVAGIAGEVERIDPAICRIVERIDVGPGLREIAVGTDGVWVTRDGI
jgi:hypothetical protein